MTGWEWFGVIAGGASVASLPVAIVLGWFGKRTAVDIHAATQLTLMDLRKGFSESQERLGQTMAGLGQILERMDERADERHREVIQVIQALKG
jgi:hypothetical protein